MRRLSNLAGHIELVADRVLQVEQDLGELCEDLRNILSPNVYKFFFYRNFCKVYNERNEIIVSEIFYYLKRWYEGNLSRQLERPLLELPPTHGQRRNRNH